MPRPFSARRAAEKAAANSVSGAVPVAVYVRHGTDHGCQSIAAQQEKALSFLATHAISFQIDSAGDVRRRIPTRPAGRRGNGRRRHQE
jgi:hypothetical protein